MPNKSAKPPRGADDATSVDSNDALNSTLRTIAAWAIWIGSGVLGLSYLSFLIVVTWHDHQWMKEIAKQHFQAIVGLPLAAVCSFLVVNTLQVSAGRIEFDLLGMKFRGASGPVVFWIAGFLAITLAIKILW